MSVLGQNGKPLIIKTGGEHYAWNVVPDDVSDYLSEVTYDPTDTESSEIDDYAPVTADLDNSYPIPKSITTLIGQEITRDGYTITATDSSTALYNDTPNVLKNVLIHNGSTVIKSGTLKPTGNLRWVRCASALNVRDIGGWECDGGIVKYGKLIRGGNPSAADRDVLVNQCGVRQELDLRCADGPDIPNPLPTSSILGDDIGYTLPPKYAWYRIKGDNLKPSWKMILRCIFDSVRTNQTVYFHCAAGADRTGTVACVIEALLGVSRSDIDKDYELTCFATGIEVDGVDVARRRNEEDWQYLISEINSLNGSTFRDKVVNWVASLGFTAKEINDFRAAMIDGSPEAVTPAIQTFTITRSLTNVTSDNLENTATEFQEYLANITPTKRHLISSVNITMGGSDITNKWFSGTTDQLKYHVEKSFTNCTASNNNSTTVSEQSYVNRITADIGYTLAGAIITITMGGIDVSQYYSDGVIAIPSVTGDLEITITAIPSAVPDSLIPLSKDANGDYLHSNVDNASVPTWVANTYYELISGDYVLTESEPADWSTNWTDYYVRTGCIKNAEIGGTGQEVARTGSIATGFIDFAWDGIKTLYFYTFGVQSTSNLHQSVSFYREDHSYIASSWIYPTWVNDGYEPGTVFAFTPQEYEYDSYAGANKHISSAKYIRISAQVSSDSTPTNEQCKNLIATIDEPF